MNAATVSKVDDFGMHPQAQLLMQRIKADTHDMRQANIYIIERALLVSAKSSPDYSQQDCTALMEGHVQGLSIMLWKLGN